MYVDDLTLWARGDPDATAEAVAEAMRITRAYEADMDWRLHEVKSKQFANLASVRRWLQRETPSIAAGSEIRDLGVVAVAGKRRKCPVAAARVQLACGRFARLRRLPVPFRWRCLMGAAAGTAAGTDGASCGRPAAGELEQLRRAAKAATRHGPRAAAEAAWQEARRAVAAARPSKSSTG